MNQTMDCEEARISLGVYVLGAIDPAERAMVDAHLASCQECRDELADLAGLPALLATVSTEEALQLGEDLPRLTLVPEVLAPEAPAPEAPAPPGLQTVPPQTVPPQTVPPQTVPQPAPPPAPPDNVREFTSARRRRGWRNGMLVAAAVVIIALGSFAGTHLFVAQPGTSNSASGDSSNFGQGSAWDTSDLVRTSSGQSAQVKYRSMGWGLQIDTRVLGIPVGTTCNLYVITKSGQRVQAANWLTDKNEGTVWYSGSAAVTDDDVAAFQVTTGGKTPPVTIEVPG